MCGSTFTFSIIDGVAQKVFFRSCEKNSFCGLSGTIGFQKGKVKTATTCCSSDSCKPQTPALPRDSTQRVGLNCSSCSTVNSAFCHTNEIIECTGEETKCILQSTIISGIANSKSAVRGCATKNICDFGSQSYDFGDGNKVKTEVMCSNGSINLLPKSMLLTIISLMSAIML
ncbi:Hypothetical predicted protein [Pelobates cultripes]|uniref:Uncharacterized protein n=1 Tax=Pelobates cultripes TaxID=61616 RepID=A0AAD1T3W7_PELCU|nr:Hypothetical predicted protein [Pelobates cultripes]